MKEITLDNVLSAYKSKGFILHTEVDRANVFGIRCSNATIDKFDDLIGIITHDAEEAPSLVFLASATTDPGKDYMENPIDGKRTAIMVAGQYLKAYDIGLHQGKYEALKQVGLVNFYQDTNKDDVVDKDVIKAQIIGANIHSTRSDIAIVRVGKFSAACQVIQKWSEFLKFMVVVKKSRSLYPDLFDYTLFEENEIA